MATKSLNTNQILADFIQTMNLPNEAAGRRVISKILVALRKDYSVADSITFCDNLPEPLKGLYSDNIGVRLKVGQIRDTDSLVSMIMVEDKKSGMHDFASGVEALNAAITLFHIIKQTQPRDRFVVISAMLPPDFIEVVMEGKGVVLLVKSDAANY